MDSIQDWWLTLDPKAKRNTVVIFSITVFLLVVSVLTTISSVDSNSSPVNTEIKHVLTDRNTREIGMDSVVSDLKIIERENKDLKDEIEKLKRDLKYTESRVSTTTHIEKQLEVIERKIADTLGSLDEVSDRVGVVERAEPVFVQNEASSRSNITKIERPSDTGSTPFRLKGQFPDSLTADDPYTYFASADLPENHQPPDTSENNIADTKGGEVLNPSSGSEHIVSQIFSFSANQEVGDVVSENGKNEKEDYLYLPSGSIISGVLLNGMDAATGQGARKDPFPALMRLQKEAILPNRFLADIRECFLIVSGYGDISSERAMLRGETLSCIRQDGSVIESKLDSYAVGEDGKTGVRGRLVSKQGQVITKSLMAGFLSGVAEGFDADPVPIVNTNPSSNNTIYETAFNSQVLENGVWSGASSALDRIAQYYLEMAEGIYPVIEIDAARQIQVIVTRGASLKIKSTKP